MGNAPACHELSCGNTDHVVSTTTGRQAVGPAMGMLQVKPVCYRRPYGGEHWAAEAQPRHTDHVVPITTDQHS